MNIEMEPDSDLADGYIESLVEGNMISPKHALFIKKYVDQGCKNATKAYYAVYDPEQKRIKPASANHCASRILMSPHIKGIVKKVLDLKSKSLLVDKEQVMGKLAEVAFSRNQDLYDKDGNLCFTSVLEQEHDNEGNLIKARQYNIKEQISALDKLMKILQSFDDGNEDSFTKEDIKEGYSKALELLATALKGNNQEKLNEG